MAVKKVSRTESAVYKVPEAARVAGVGERSIRNGIDEGPHSHDLKFGRNLGFPKLRLIDGWTRAGSD